MESMLAENSAPGALRQGQQLVFASIEGGQLLDVLQTLAQRRVGSQIDWTASLDGSRQERMIAFEGDDALERAEDLMAALTALKVDCYRGSLTEVAAGQEAICAARRKIDSAADAVNSQAARQPPW